MLINSQACFVYVILHPFLVNVYGIIAKTNKHKGTPYDELDKDFLLYSKTPTKYELNYNVTESSHTSIFFILTIVLIDLRWNYYVRLT